MGKNCSKKLSYSRDHYKRSFAAKSITAAKEVLDRLSFDKNDHVRFNVASNPNTSDEALNRLRNDKNQSVREAASKTLYSCLE